MSQELKKVSLNKDICYSRMSVMKILLSIEFLRIKNFVYTFEKLGHHEISPLQLKPNPKPTRTRNIENQFD